MSSEKEKVRELSVITHLKLAIFQTSDVLGIDRQGDLGEWRKKITPFLDNAMRLTLDEIENPF